MREALDEVVARHRDHLVQHVDHDGQGPCGWESTLHPTGHPEVEAVSWYDDADQDVVVRGGAPCREWFMVDDEGVFRRNGVASVRSMEPVVGQAGRTHLASSIDQ